MKKTLCFFLFTAFFCSIKAQKYQPIDSTIVWSTSEVGKLMTSCYVTTSCKYYLMGYELNNGRVWSKLFTSYYSYGVGGPCSTYVAPPPVYNSPYGYVSNDTINKKVYYVSSLPPNFTPTFTNVVYDFNKNIGDSMYFKIPSMASAYKFPITGIDSVLFSGKYHKRFLTDCYPAVFYLSGTKITFIEGIGCSLGAFTHTVNSMGEYQSNLVCFANPTQTMSITNHSVYVSGGTCANITMGINTESFIPGNVFPNPAANYFVIQPNSNSPQKITYRVYNWLGEILLNGVSEGQTQINTETLSNGVYFIKLSSDSGSETKKLVVQKE